MFGGLLQKMRGLLGNGTASAGLKSPDFNPAAMQGADPHSLFQLPKAGNISMPDAAGAKPPVGGMFARPSMEAMQYFNPPAGRASSSMNPGDIQPMQVPPRPLPDTPRLPIAPRIAMPGANQNAERALNMMEANAISADGIAPVAPSFNPSTIGADSLRIPEMRTDSVRDVPVPQLPGHKGEPVPYNPVDYAKYRYVMDKMGRDEQGNETGIKRDWKDMLKTGLLGAAQGIQQAGGNPWGALGGFGAGFAGAAVSPQAGREFIFDTAIKPGVMEQEQRGIQQQDRQRQTRMDDLRRRQIEAGVKRDEAIANRPLPKVGEASWGTYDIESGKPIYERPQVQPTEARMRTYTDDQGFVREVGSNKVQLDPQSGQPIKAYQRATTTPKDKPMTISEALAAEAADEGDIEQITEDSLQGRLETLKGKLSPRDKAIIEGQQLPDATEDETRKALQRWEQVQQVERSNIRRKVTETRKMKAQQRIGKGGQRSSGGGMGNTAPRTLDDVMKYLQ